MKRNSGMALAVVLPLLVLMTAAVVAFFVLATSNRAEVRYRAKRTEVAQIAPSAVAGLTDRLRTEIVNGSDELSGPRNPVYSPKTPADMVVARRLAAGIAPTDADFRCLVRQSVPDGTPPADPEASNHQTSDPARGGVFVRPERWNAPRLLRGNASFASGSKRVPHWVYVTADGPTTTLDSRVIGRFAYNLYETGGLLDANIAGHPSGTPSAEDLMATQAGADLTDLPGMNAAAIQSLISFRNPNASDYPGRVRDLARDGFLRSFSGNSTNRFFYSRQDLLRYGREENPGLQGALPFLSHRSRQISAPSWGPTYNAADFGGSSQFAYRTNRNQATSVNRFLPGYRIPNGTSVERIDGSMGEAGDPFLDRRFPLEWLAWLADARMDTRQFDPGPELINALARINDQRARNGAAALNAGELIRRAFGLQWVQTDASWDYVGADGADLGEINTDWANMQPLGSGRLPAPDFFQILRAAILDGSLGVASEDKNQVYQAPMAGRDMSQDIEPNKSYHVLQIGANIIDNADRDNFPTTISLGSPSPRLTVHGVEDLPYLASVSVGSISNQQRNGPSLPISPPEVPAPNLVSNYIITMVPRFFNPHAPSSPSSTPDSYRCTITEGAFSKIEVQILNSHNGTVKGDPSALGQLAPPSIFKGQIVNLPATAPGDFRGDVLVTTADASSRIRNRAPWTTEDMCGFLLYERGNVTITATRHAAILYLNNFMIEVQYEHPAVGFKTYDTLAGHENFPIATGIDGTRTSSSPGFNQNRMYLGNVYRRTLVHEVANYEITKWDPRTRRWSGAWTGGRVTKTTATYSASWPTEQPSNANFREVERAYPFPSLLGLENGPLVGNGGPPSYPALLPEARDNEETRAVSGQTGWINKKDLDGVLRPAYASRGGGSANPFRDLADRFRRPVILQRPYRSVGELGHVFRDIPWKNLDFSSERSADSGLLDVFCIHEEPPVSAGQIALNSAPEEVIEAVLNGANVTSPASIAQKFVNSVSVASGTPLPSVSGLSTFADKDGTDNIKADREAPVRALSTVGQTRTWNLFADVIAQSGRFAPGGTAAGDFIVEGENRTWFSVALDRMTGEPISNQCEPVLE